MLHIMQTLPTPNQATKKEGFALYYSTSDVSCIKGHGLNYFIFSNKVPFQASSPNDLKQGLFLILRRSPGQEKRG